MKAVRYCRMCYSLVRYERDGIHYCRSKLVCPKCGQDGRCVCDWFAGEATSANSITLGTDLVQVLGPSLLR